MPSNCCLWMSRGFTPFFFCFCFWFALILFSNMVFKSVLLLSPPPIKNSWGDVAFGFEQRFIRTLRVRITEEPLLFSSLMLHGINSPHPTPTCSLFQKRRKKESQKGSHWHLTLKSCFAIQSTWGLSFSSWNHLGRKTTHFPAVLLYYYLTDFQFISHSSGLVPVYFPKGLIWKIISLAILNLSQNLYLFS